VPHDVYAAAVADVSRVWQNKLFARTIGASYDLAMGRPTAARRFGRLMMGADVDRIYRAMGTVGEMPDGSMILDVPCGGGIALRELRNSQRVRYVGVDISPAMLDRARRRISPQHQSDVEIIEGNIERMPFGDRLFDLCICFNGLHCVPDPSAAVREIARCLKPGGRLIGEFATRGQLRRADAYMALLRATGTFGRAGTPSEARQWFAEAGLLVETFECTGAIAHFVVRRPE
jgi:ubiquinone/menaquinone biosynthesis C-methylase UbiE